MRLLRPGSVMVAVVSAVAVVTAWIQGPPALDAAEARDVAVDALAEVEVAAEPITEPESTVHETQTGSSVDVWSVRLAVTGEASVVLELRVQRDAGQLVFVDDVVAGRDDPTYLTDEQFAVLDAYRDDEVADRWRLGNLLATVSAVVAVVVAAVLASRRSRPLLEESR